MVGVAIGGVLAIQVITQAPALLTATRAFAEDVVSPKAKPAVAPDASILGGPSPSSAASKAPPPACAPTAAELAKEAGLSPAELQVLQSLSDRRSQLDQRDHDLDTQVELIAAAEAKLDARIQQMNGLKSDIQGLIGQANQQQQAEQARLVHVYEDMNPKQAAAAMTLLDDSVRVPIGAAMKERKLADVLAKMDPADAKTLTEKLAARVAGSPILANAQKALNPQAATPAQPPAAGAPNAAANTAAGQTPAAPAQQTAAAAATTPPSATATATPAKVARPHRVARAKPKPKAKPAASDDTDQTAAAGATSAPKAPAAPAKPAVPPTASAAAVAPAAKPG
jgi:flagellar motility protein MotE (MotC chaperone)